MRSGSGSVPMTQVVDRTSLRVAEGRELARCSVLRRILYDLSRPGFLSLADATSMTGSLVHLSTSCALSRARGLCAMISLSSGKNLVPRIAVAIDLLLGPDLVGKITTPSR